MFGFDRFFEQAVQVDFCRIIIKKFCDDISANIISKAKASIAKAFAPAFAPVLA
jgi:hypothetical protein